MKIFKKNSKAGFKKFRCFTFLNLFNKHINECINEYIYEYIKMHLDAFGKINP